MRSSVRILVTAFALAALCPVVACGFDSASPSFGPGNRCTASADCAQGVCDEGFCVDMSTNTVSVAVEVIRSASDTLRTTPASWVFAPESFSGNQRRDFTLPPTRTVAGAVRWNGEPVPATLRFTQRLGESVMPINPSTVAVDTVRSTEAVAGPGASDYAATLVVGQSYDVAVIPSGDLIADGGTASPAVRALPPVYESIQVTAELTTEPFRFDVDFGEDLEQECGAGELFGCKLTGRILSFDGETASPAVGLQVRAIEKESGRVVSSIGETDPSGDYAIRVSADAEPYVVRLTSSAGASAPFPSVSLDPEVVFDADPVGRRVFIPRVDTVVLTGSVQDVEQRPVQGATLRFSSTGIFDASELGFEGSFKSSASTANDGKFTVQLLPGTYDVIVTPPDDSANAWAPVSAQTIVVGGFSGANEAAPIVLGSQVTLRGSCKTFAGDPAAGVTIAARARADEGGLQRSQETVSTATGDYQMKVDAGLYDLLIKLSDSTGFPWLVTPAFDVEPEDDPATQSWELPPPIVVRGEIKSAGGSSVGGAPLRAYIITGFPPRAIQIGETTSAEDGTYQLLISPTLGDL